MRRATLGALLTALFMLGGSASAGADLLLEYADLAHRQLKPAPLVPTTAPKALRPLTSNVEDITGFGRNGYRLRVLDLGADDPTAIIALERGRLKSVAGAVKEARRNGMQVRSTRVRGHRGKLITRRNPRYRSLVWKEGGALYLIGTGTTRTISLRALRSFAKGLQPLEREYVTAFCDDEGFCQGAIAVTTTETASVLVEWEARCEDPQGQGQAVLGNAGSATFSLLPRSGDNFSFGLTAGDGQPWTLAGTGTVAPDAVTLNVRATGAPKGQPCDTGPLVLRLDQRFAD